MEKVTVLIADDHKLIRETWKYLLSTVSHFEVIADCGNAEDAVETAKVRRPNIILMDIDMPPFSGIEATKMIRKFSPGSKVIGVSMHCHPTYVKKMLQAGAKGFITKNSSQEEMLKGISEVYNGNSFICSEVEDIMSADPAEDEAAPNINALTTREVEIISYVKQGHSSKEIAATLHLSVKTVQGHRQNIHKKLKLNNSAALVNYINNSPTLILPAIKER